MPSQSRGKRPSAGAVAESVTSLLGGCLVVTLPAELNCTILQRIRAGVLETASRTPARGVVFDASAVCAVDSRTFGHLAETAEMVDLLGFEAVLVGLQPGVVSTIVDLDIDTQRIRVFRGIDDAIGDFSRRGLGQPPAPEPAEDSASGETTDSTEGDAP